MNLEVNLLPNKSNPTTIMVRLIPETVKDDRQVELLGKKLRGFNVLSTTPTVKDRICLSLIFVPSTKRAGSK